MDAMCQVVATWAKKVCWRITWALSALGHLSKSTVAYHHGRPCVGNMGCVHEDHGKLVHTSVGKYTVNSVISTPIMSHTLLYPKTLGHGCS